jgi:ABC-type multidrug transport system ATPase subunit
MQALCGRSSGLAISGQTYLHGHRVHMKHSNDFAYVPQKDILIGELTAREMLMNNAILKLDKPKAEIESIVDKLLKEFGLDHIADNMIGTIFKRGLSGGQKKRVDIGIEFVAPPLVLFLDEPTSGLDGQIALEILKVIQRIVKSSADKLSIILSIHQPNQAILDLFDHLLILGKGGMMYFGTVAESMTYFTNIGFPPPAGISPTDFYLKITDQSFSSNVTFSFESSYSCSIHARQVTDIIMDSVAHAEDFLEMIDEETGEESDRPTTETTALVPRSARNDTLSDTVFEEYEFTPRTGYTGFGVQCWTLMKRDLVLAKRDLTLYYLQFALHSFYGFLVGAAFFRLDYNIDEKMNYIPAGLVWIVFMNSYMHVFKVYHIVVHQARTAHEMRNGSYSILAAWTAESIVTCFMLVIFTPGFIIAYFMMGFPLGPFPFLLLSYWVCAIAGESLLNLLSIFFLDATAAIVTSQALLVILTVFCGVFIAWDEMPDYYYWLQESAAITQSSRAAIVAVSSNIEYDCELVDSVCYGPTGNIFQCVAGSVAGTSCVVDGREALLVTQGIGVDESHWKYFGALVGIFVALRLALLLFMYYPPREIYLKFRTILLGDGVLGTRVALRKLRLQMTYLLKQTHPSDEGDMFAVKQSSLLSPRGVPSIQFRTSSQAEYDTKMTIAPTISGKQEVSKFGSQFFKKGELNAALQFDNLNLTLKSNGKVLLSDCSAKCEAGRVMAMMGPSGAGDQFSLPTLLFILIFVGCGLFN